MFFVLVCVCLLVGCVLCVILCVCVCVCMCVCVLLSVFVSQCRYVCVSEYDSV